MSAEHTEPSPGENCDSAASSTDLRNVAATLKEEVVRLTKQGDLKSALDAAFRCFSLRDRFFDENVFYCGFFVFGVLAKTASVSAGDHRKELHDQAGQVFTMLQEISKKHEHETDPSSPLRFLLNILIVNAMGEDTGREMETLQAMTADREEMQLLLGFVSIA